MAARRKSGRGEARAGRFGAGRLGSKLPDLGLLGWVLLAALVSLLTGATLQYFGLPRLEGKLEVFGRAVTLAESRAFWLACLLPFLALGLLRSLADLPWPQRLLSLALRSAFFCALLLGLSRPEQVEKSSRVCAVALVDVSTSVGDGALRRLSGELQKLDSARGEKDELRLIGFAQGAREIPLVRDDSGKILDVSVQTLRAAAPGGATDVAGAVELASAFTSTDCLARYVIYTDGIETRGRASAAISEARSRGVRVSTKLLSEAPPPDAGVTGVSLPGGVKVGEPFRVRVELGSSGKVKGQLRLYQGEVLNGLDGARNVTLSGGTHSETFESVVRVAGDVTYRAEFVPEGQDQFAQNNRFESSLEVPGPPRILLVDSEPSQVSYLAQALVAQQLDVDVRSVAAMPQTQGELSPFQFVILSDVAKKDVSRASESLLLDYVRAGGGLLFAGGEAGFGPGGWQGSAMEKALPVNMDGQKEREVPGVAMALVIDRSGSMGGLPLQMAKEACKATVGVLSPSDLIEVVAFDSQPQRFVKMQPARYRARIESSISTIVPGGGTEIFPSLDMAYQDLLAVEARKKHIILLTDGNASSDGLYELAGAAFADGITVTSVGLGGGVNQSLLTMIAEEGGGRFHSAEDPSHLPRIFTRETELISKKAEVTDWFPVSLVRPAEFLKNVGIGSAPLLRGYTSTQMQGPPAELILMSDRGEPILARKPFGLGYTLAWTSDLKARWATDWLRWASFGRLFAQMIREHQKSDDTEVRPMHVEVVGDNLVATLEAYDAQENFDNSLSSSLTVRLLGQSDSGAPAAEQPTNLKLVAPGTYQAEVPLTEFGSYAIKATHKRKGEGGELRSAGVSFASVTRPYPEEFKTLNPRLEVLSRWAKLGSGSDNPQSSEVFGAQGDEVLSRKPVQNNLLLAALVLFLLDLLMRRVRLFDRQSEPDGVAG